MLLKHKLYTSLLMATLFPLCISTLLYSNSLRDITTKKLIKEDLPTALSNVRNAIEWQLSKPIATSRSIAKNLFVEQWIIAQEPQNKTQDFIDYLHNIKETDRAISAFIVSDNSQSYYSYSGEIRTLTYPSDNWFNEFIASTKDYELTFDINKNTGKAKVYVNHVIEIGGERKGIAGVSHTVSSMNEIIENQSIGKTGRVFLTDNLGEIKLHPDQSLIGQVIPLNHIIFGQQSLVTHNEKNYVTSSIPLISLDWHLVAEIPQQELYGPIDQAVRKNLMLGGVIAIFGIMLIILFVNRMFKPIEQITTSVSTLATKIIGKR